MAIKPSPTIAGKLRKLFSNNKQTIEPAIDDTLPGGGGGGALVVNITDESATNPDFIQYLVCDKTAKEMLDAMQKGIVQGVSGDEWKSFYIFFGAKLPSDLDPGIRFNLLVPNQEDVVISMNFFAETEDDYPVHFESR